MPARQPEPGEPGRRLTGMKRIGVVLLLLAVGQYSALLGQRQGGAAPDARQDGARGRGAAVMPERNAPAGRQGRGRGQAVGTAVIRGRVTAADTGAPLRRAQISAQGSGGRPQSVTADADGRFELRDLPAGRWRLSAAKAGFVTLTLGQRRAFESVPALEVAEGQRIDNADFALPRGSAITGRIFDEFGDPVANVRVQVLRSETFRGGRRLAPTGVQANTDDTGAYRLYGLAPGGYLVGVRPGTGPLDLGAEGSAGYAPTYFPGTTNVAEAERVTVGVGDEQSNVSFGLLPVRTARVSGTVLDSSGAPLEGGVVNLTTAIESTAVFPVGAGGRVQADGSFTLSNVIPGNYILVATAVARRGRGSAGAAEAAYTPLTVSGDVAGIAVTTTQGATLTGTVTSSGSGQPPTGGLRIRSYPLRPAIGLDPRSAQVATSGTFTLSGLIGPTQLLVEQLPEGWMVERVEVNGSDVTDRALELSGTERATMRVVLTNRVSNVRGTVSARIGSTYGYNVVIFPDDPATWPFPSRYVRSLRTDRAGAFDARALPPHDKYLAVAVDYLEESEGSDPEFLQRIRSAATPFALREGDAVTLELQLVER